ncbi:hypothetical protein BZZ01_07575 [Nostocales cyanobacterium HT-58-2]|nr:hypothetical protein BZZ01_07575 [Nostocales cyanobacterium HT-58-2]
MADEKLQRDRLRQALNLIFAIAQWVAVYFPVVTGIGVDIKTSSRATQTPVVPADYAFSVWLPIFVGCIAYGIYQALPQNREEPLLRRIGWTTAAAFISLTIYAIVAAFFPKFWSTGTIFLFTLAALLVTLLRIAEHNTVLTWAQRAFVWLSLSLFTGWVSLAVFANWSPLVRTPLLSGLGLPETDLFLVFLFAAAALGATVTFASRGNIVYALTLVWGLIGIVVANTVERTPNSTVAVVAGCLAALLGLSLLGAQSLSKTWSTQ